MRARRDDPAAGGDDTGHPVPVRWLAAAAAAVAAHPSLWVTAMRQAVALARPGWWRRPPFVPVPAAGYLRFRLETAYGGRGDRQPPPGDLLTYLRWCRSARRWRRPLGG
ncbi:MAG: hypothetical protein ACLFXM_04450 [Acidimicrobiia bacterium]